MIKKPTLKQCRSCRDWRACNGHDYYKPGEVVYCSWQVRWLISEFLAVEGDQIVLQRFTWPREKTDTGYTEAPQTQHAVSAHAPHETVCQVVGELSRRLEMAGKDGRLLVLEVKAESLDLSQDARNALNYASGWRRKWGYRGWLKQRVYRDSRVEMTTKK